MEAIMESTDETTPQGSGAQARLLESARRPLLKVAIMTLIALAFISAAPDKAWATFGVKPVVNCVTFDEFTNQIIVYWGFDNTNPFEITVDKRTRRFHLERQGRCQHCRRHAGNYRSETRPVGKDILFAKPVDRDGQHKFRRCPGSLVELCRQRNEPKRAVLLYVIEAKQPLLSVRCPCQAATSL